MADDIRQLAAEVPTDLWSHLTETERRFLSGKQDRGADLESAVRIFLEFLRGFEFFRESTGPVSQSSARLGLLPAILITRWRANWVPAWPKRVTPS